MMLVFVHDNTRSSFITLFYDNVVLVFQLLYCIPLFFGQVTSNWLLLKYEIIQWIFCYLIDDASSIGSRFLLGVKLLLGFTRLGSSVIGLSVKNSFNLNLRQNVVTSAFNLVVFFLGTGVNFRPLFTSMSIMVLLKLLLDRFTTRGMLRLLVCRFFLANLGLCLAVDRMAKKNHFVYSAVLVQSFPNQVPSLLHFRSFCCPVSLIQVPSLLHFRSFCCSAFLFQVPSLRFRSSYLVNFLSCSFGACWSLSECWTIDFSGL